MKILFVADIHIKLGQKKVPEEWAINRFRQFIRKLDEAQKEVNVVILGGDIFDRVPSLEELKLYFEMISVFDVPTAIYSGNHEAVKKDTTFLSSLKEVTQRINSNVEIIDEFTQWYGVDILPYNRLRSKPFPVATSNILCTHVRGEIPPHVKPEIDLSLLDPWCVVLAGDLHSYSNSQRNILYPGSPYTISFHRDFVKAGAIVLDTLTLNHEWINFDLPQLIRRTAKPDDELIKDPIHHIIYEIEGTVLELSNVKEGELIDKKISTKSTDASMYFDSNYSMHDELVDYLSIILNLPADQIDTIVHEFNKHKDRLIDNEDSN